MQKVIEKIKFDIGLAPQSLASTNATGEWFDFADSREALAIMFVGPAAATKTAILAIQEAKDSSGTSSQALSGATVTHTANANSNIITATLVSVAAADTIVVNGLTFTAQTSASLSAREFDQSGDDTADAVSLVAGINDATYGVPNVTVTAVESGPPTRLSYHVSRVKHGTHEELEVLSVCFDTWETIRAFHAQFLIRAANHPQPQEGELHFIVEQGSPALGAPL